MSILCSTAFLLCGWFMANIDADRGSANGYNTIHAASPPHFEKMNTASLPQDLLLDLAKQKSLSIAEKTTANTDSSLIDSLKNRIMILEQKGQVTKVKWRKVLVPKPVIQKDTVNVPVYYIATQVGNKEGPTGECISVYEVHKVDEICPETINSSTKGINEYHIKGGD